MPLQPRESKFEEITFQGKVVYLDDLETLVGIFTEHGTVLIEVTQHNGTDSEVPDLRDLAGREVAYMAIRVRNPDETRLIGYYEPLTITLGGQHFNRAVIDKSKPDAIVAVRHFIATLDQFKPPWSWRLRHPRSDFSDLVVIDTDRRHDALASKREKSHDAKVAILGATAGAVIGAVVTYLVQLFG